MKPFLKAVLLINHTQNKDLVDFGQLRELAEEKGLIRDEDGKDLFFTTRSSIFLHTLSLSLRLREEFQ